MLEFFLVVVQSANQRSFFRVQKEEFLELCVLDNRQVECKRVGKGVRFGKSRSIWVTNGNAEMIGMYVHNTCK